MRTRVTLLAVAMAAGLVACVPGGTESGLSVQLEAPVDATSEAVDAALEIIDRRFMAAEGIAVVFDRSDDGTVTVFVPGLTDTERAISLITARGELSFRPVLEAHTVSPLIGTDTPKIDPETGLTIEDDITDESWLAHEGFLGVQVLRLGPAGLMASDVEDAFPYFGDEPPAWLVNVSMSDEGSDTFADMTAQAAAFPVGDPRRQIAIVLDGEVISAPAISPDVSPEVGITGGLAVISVGQTENAEADAHDLASVLANETLPVALEVLDVARLD